MNNKAQDLMNKYEQMIIAEKNKYEEVREMRHSESDEKKKDLYRQMQDSHSDKIYYFKLFIADLKELSGGLWLGG